jgi:RimK family alpha-L-glutamate ligase
MSAAGRDSAQKTEATDRQSGRLLALGPDQGWHADQLRSAATRLGWSLDYATYESLTTTITADGRTRARCDAGELAGFDAVLCRTMPAGSLEQVTFRLGVLHAAQASGVRVINPPRTLELAIDKFATLAIVGSLGYPVPQTVVTQTRKDALSAFDSLGGDVVVKPIFGGEGRGVMRIRDRQLAWYTFSTLEQLGAAIYVQRFIAPGGRDTRLLVIGDQVLGIRRTNENDFRTNVAGGATGRAVELAEPIAAMARRIAGALSIVIGSVDVIDCEPDSYGSDGVVVEVNGVPGWKGAQGCLQLNLAETMIRTIIDRCADVSGSSTEASTDHAAASFATWPVAASLATDVRTPAPMNAKPTDPP